MTPPPLPPGCDGYPVAPHIHTGCPEPERDGWTDTADDDPDPAHRALDVAIHGLHELQAKYVAYAGPGYGEVAGLASRVVADLMYLIGEIGATR